MSTASPPAVHERRQENDSLAWAHITYCGDAVEVLLVDESLASAAVRECHTSGKLLTSHCAYKREPTELIVASLKMLFLILLSERYMYKAQCVAKMLRVRR
jgi:hypothetical protein